MQLEFIPKAGIGGGAPVVLEVSQMVLRLADGTPVCVAAPYGMDGAYAISKAGDPDFNRMLRAVGVTETVICDTIELPKPYPGARLVAGPDTRG